MKIVAKKDRKLLLINAANTKNENKAETITLVVPEEYEDYNKKIVFVTPNETVWDVITNNEYKITNAITKYEQVDFYIWLTKEVDGESIDFRTKTKTLNFYHNVDASDEITDEEIHGVNTVVNLLEEEIEKVENLNIEATKIGSTTTVTITRKDGTTQEVEILDGAKGDKGDSPIRGVDYWTEEDKQEIIDESTVLINGKIEEYNDNAAAKLNQYNQNSVQKTNDYNTNAEQKMSAYNTNATEKLSTYNSNATEKFNDYNSNAEQKETNYNTNASQKVESFNTNANSKLSEYNSNAETKKTAYDENATQKTNSFNTNATNKLTEYNTNHTEKVSAYNSNSIQKLNAFNENATQKTEDFDEHTEEIQEEIEALQTENARLKATLPTTTGTGQDITLNKTAEMEFVKPPLPMGNSEQNGEPSPTNEVPINNVTGDLEVKVQNKNLCNGINQNTYLNFVVNQCGIADGNSGLYIKVNGETYTISTTEIQTRYRVACTTLEPSEIAQGAYNGQNKDNTSNSITINTSGYNYLVVNATDLSSIQIEKRTTATSSVPHKEQVFTFPLGNEKLMLGDYLADDGIHHVRGQVVLNGSENWELIGSTETYYEFQFTNLNPRAKNEYTFPISSHFSNKANNRIVVKYNTLLVRVPIEANITTVQEFKTWLSNNNVTVEYILAEEVIVPYTSAQQEVYNQIKQAISYEEQTNISSNQNALFSVEAYQSTKLVLKEMATAIVALGGV